MFLFLFQFLLRILMGIVAAAWRSCIMRFMVEVTIGLRVVMLFIVNLVWLITKFVMFNSIPYYHFH